MPAGVKVEKTALGPVLADSKGMTLYTFDKDATPGKSACNGPCAQNWPPLAVAPMPSPWADWTVVTRDDGSKQWAYKGKPLYRLPKTKNRAIRPGMASLTTPGTLPSLDASAECGCSSKNGCWRVAHSSPSVGLSGAVFAAYGWVISPV